jgi:transposase
VFWALDEAVPDDHLVRKIRALLDLSWVYAELAPYYSEIGRPSIDPVLMIQMLIIGYVLVVLRVFGVAAVALSFTD